MRLWYDQIGISSYRGIVFETAKTSGTFGRRGTLHEFPFKDFGFAEDVGKKSKEIQFAAYVDGDNYLERRAALISAIEDIDTPGTLILKTGEILRVKPTANCTFVDDDSIGGITFFGLKFLEAGQNEVRQ